MFNHHVYIYIYMCVCVSIYICVCVYIYIYRLCVQRQFPRFSAHGSFPFHGSKFPLLQGTSAALPLAAAATPLLSAAAATLPAVIFHGGI